MKQKDLSFQFMNFISGIKRNVGNSCDETGGRRQAWFPGNPVTGCTGNDKWGEVSGKIAQEWAMLDARAKLGGNGVGLRLPGKAVTTVWDRGRREVKCTQAACQCSHLALPWKVKLLSFRLKTQIRITPSLLWTRTLDWNLQNGLEDGMELFDFGKYFIGFSQYIQFQFLAGVNNQSDVQSFLRHFPSSALPVCIAYCSHCLLHYAIWHTSALSTFAICISGVTNCASVVSLLLQTCNSHLQSISGGD